MSSRERILILPFRIHSPGGFEQFPAVRALLDRLHSVADVEVFHWPYLSREDPGLSGCDDVLSAIRTALSEESHLLAVGGSGGLALAALDGQRVRSLICDGLSSPTATLRSLGLPTTAAADSPLIHRPRHLSQNLRPFMQGAAEDEVRRCADVVEADVNWDQWQQVMGSWDQMDLVRQPPSVTAPCLFLDTRAALFCYSDMAEFFLRFVPQARVEYLEAWPVRLHTEEAGDELAGKVISFVEEVAGKGA